MTAPSQLTAIEIAKIACNVESEGIDFYHEAAAAAENGEVQAVFKELATQERRHLKIFREMFKVLDAKAGGSGAATVMLFDETLTAYLTEVSKGMVFPATPQGSPDHGAAADISHVLRVGIEVEKNSILFYTEMVRHNAFCDSRRLLDDILNEEKAHLVLLSKLLKRSTYA